MKEHMNYLEARGMLLETAVPVQTERVPLESAAGRVLAQALIAAQNVPPFDRSPYDGYALRAADTAEASAEHPAALSVLEEIAAGAVPTQSIRPGTASRIMTGAPIPKGADAVVMHEMTEFTTREVRLFAPVKSGANIIKAGEDVRAGQLLAHAGAIIDAGLIGSLASQGVRSPLVFRAPLIGLISTGDEVAAPGETLENGKIYDSNRYSIEAVLNKNGCRTEYLGLAGDSVETISRLLADGLSRCDAVVLSGGVSAGDFDLTPAAMQRANVTLLGRGVKMKPGMACAYGVKDGKMVLGLSGNPAAALTNLYVIVLPAIRKLCGQQKTLPDEITVTLTSGFGKKAKNPRFLHGTLDLSGGEVKMRLPQAQGNVVISSMIGCDVMAVVPAGTEALQAGTQLKGFVL